MKILLKSTEIVKLPKSTSFPNYQRYEIQTLIAQIENFNKYYVKMSHNYLFYFLRNMPSKNVMVGRFIVLNDSASSEMVIQIYFHFFRYFLKVLELFECRRGDPYMTTNRNFVHS